MKTFNIYICGVGGQGIGLLSEILLRAGDYAGYQAKAVDTHGLAQRGGIVVSQLRLGDSVFTPLIPGRKADLGVALELHEAARAAENAIRDGGTLIYYNTVLQPLGVRLGQEEEVSSRQLKTLGTAREIKVITVEITDLPDARMQNIGVLSSLCQKNLIPRVGSDHYTKAMKDLLQGEMLENNLKLFYELQKSAH